MTAITEPPKAEFRLRMLLSDTRYRSVTIQIVALILVMLGVGYLVNNVIANLAALGSPACRPTISSRCTIRTSSLKRCFVSPTWPASTYILLSYRTTEAGTRPPGQFLTTRHTAPRSTA